MAVAVQLRVPRSSSKTTAFVDIFEYKFDFDDAHVSNSVILLAAPVLLRSDYFLDFELDPDCDSLTDSFGVATLLDSTFAVELGFDYDFRSGWVFRTRCMVCRTTRAFSTSLGFRTVLAEQRHVQRRPGLLLRRQRAAPAPLGFRSSEGH